MAFLGTKDGSFLIEFGWGGSCAMLKGIGRELGVDKTRDLNLNTP